MSEVRGPAAFALLVLAMAELLGMGVWFTASAISADLQVALSLSPVQATWLTALVQLGFVVGTAVAALLNLADLFPARRYFAVSAVMAAVANAALVAVPGFWSAALSRVGTGFFLAGVYPPAMKMAATWFKSDRGLAIGVVVGALTFGKALPFLGVGREMLGWRTVVLAASAGSLVAAALVWTLYREGPHRFDRRPFDWKLVRLVVADRPTRLATIGYLGHMWELYAMWTAVPLFLTYVLGARGGNPGLGSVLAFSVIAMGALGSVAAGVLADRWGRERVAGGAMAVSGVCALTVGLASGAPLAALMVLLWVWGLAVVADSAQFSALVTEVSPRHAAGTALMLQTSVGFLLTMVTIQSTPWIAERWGWEEAFALLALGPVVGIWAMGALRRLRGTNTSV